MRFFAIAACLFFAAPVAADTAKKSEVKAPAKVEPAKAEPAKADPMKQTCKKRVVGKGLDRKVVCEFEQEIVITGQPPKPGVVVVPNDGRKVTGRPKQTDPLAGLPRRRETSR